jgi:hypothetical protein
MTSVQLPPLGSVSNTAPSSSATGGGDASPSSGPAEQPQKTTAAPPPPPKPVLTTPEVPVAARAAAAAAQAAEVARQETPAFSLDVGLIHGSFKVFVDVTDRDSHRFIARIYGPKGQVAAAPPPAVKRSVTA